MRSDYTHITVVLDSSGSMSSIADDTIGGFNTFLKAQKEAPGKATFTQVHFSSGRWRNEIKSGIMPCAQPYGQYGQPPSFAPVHQLWNLNPYQSKTVQDPYYTVDDFADIQSILELDHHRFIPRGMTPLLDSIGRAIIETGQHLAALSEDQRPAKVLFVVITDGHENASKFFSKDQVQSLIEQQKSVYSWDFMFLGANIDAVAVGTSYGFNQGSSVTFGTTKEALSSTYSLLRSKAADYRSAEVGSELYTSSVNFTPEERTLAMTGVSPVSPAANQHSAGVVLANLVANPNGSFQQS